MMPQDLRVFVSSTSQDLDPYRAAAREEILQQEFRPIMMEHFSGGPGPTIEACQERVRSAHAVLLLVAFRRGWVPSVEQGGDGKRSITAWELEAAERKGIPVLVMLAEDTWPGRLWEESEAARAWLRDFRANLNRVATFFSWEDPLREESRSLPFFRSKVRDLLVANRDRIQVSVRPPSVSASKEALSLRYPPAAGPVPDRPYPLLEPYAHPATLAGRDEDLQELQLQLKQRQTLLCLYAPSGAGKSSLLQAGLLPELRNQKLPAVLDLHADEPALAARLLAGILAEPGRAPQSDDFLWFAEELAGIRRAGAPPPVFILDQFEAVFERDRRRRALSQLGPLMASTFQRIPGVEGPLCRWLLAYRQDFHGEVMAWLEDVLGDARTEGRALDLPHDLGSPDRCLTWAMRVLGQPRPGGDPVESAAHSFSAAIEKPLLLRGPDALPIYPWRIDHDDAMRLARAFAEQRKANPELPLTPQLQVVLARLLDEARPQSDGTRVIAVPQDPTTLIRDSLEAHLGRALDTAFPATRDGAARQVRTRALLALRELADAEGRRAQNLPASTLLAALGENGTEILERLSGPGVRLLVPQPKGDGSLWYSLPHDSLAEVITRLFREDQRLREYSLDSKLVWLWRLVGQRSEFYQRTGDPTALDLTRRQAYAIRHNQPTLLWDPTRRQWWEKARQLRWRRDRQLLAIAAGLAALAVLLYTSWTLGPNAGNGELQARERVLAADMGQALEALRELTVKHGYSSIELLKILRRRAKNDIPMLFVDGPRHFLEPERLALLVPVVDRLRLEYGREPVTAGAMVAALDHYSHGNTSGHREQAKVLRLAIVEMLRQLRKPPAWKAEDWVTVSLPLVPHDRYSRPHLSPASEAKFLLQRHEVTNAEYIAFQPMHELRPVHYTREKPAQYDYDLALAKSRPDLRDHPAIVNWFEAYAFAAWLGGSLLTGAEGEILCRTAFPDAPEKPEQLTPPELMKSLRLYAWFGESSDGALHRTATRRQDRLGLFDLLGNADEWEDEWMESNRDDSRDGKPVTTLLSRQRGGPNQYPGESFRYWSNSYTDPTSRYETGMRVKLPIGSLRHTPTR